jgi:hypothetical protein
MSSEPKEYDYTLNDYESNYRYLKSLNDEWFIFISLNNDDDELEESLIEGVNIPKAWKTDINYPYDKLLKLKKYMQKQTLIKIKKETEQLDNYYISGPSEITTLINQITGQRVVLFGEAHGHEGCDEEKMRGDTILSIVTYLKIIFEDKRKIDFYLETPILHLQSDEQRERMENMSIEQRDKEQFDEFESIRKKYREEKGYDSPKIPNKQPESIWLHKIEDSVKWCMDSKIRDEKCPFENARIHSTDIRSFNVLAEMLTELSKITTQDGWEKYKKRYCKEISDMSKIRNCNDYVDYLKTFFGKNKSKKSNLGPIEKQLKQTTINIDQLDNAILSVCKSEINPLSHLIPNQKNIKRITPAEYAKEFSSYLQEDNLLPKSILRSKKFLDTTQSQVSMLLDVYTFLRMIRKFSDGVQKYIIFYGGINHCQNIKIMLQTVGFEIVPNNSRIFGTPIIDNLPRCIQLNGFDIFDF